MWARSQHTKASVNNPQRGDYVLTFFSHLLLCLYFFGAVSVLKSKPSRPSWKWCKKIPTASYLASRRTLTSKRRRRRGASRILVFPGNLKDDIIASLRISERDWAHTHTDTCNINNNADLMPRLHPQQRLESSLEGGCSVIYVFVFFVLFLSFLYVGMCVR